MLPITAGWCFIMRFIPKQLWPTLCWQLYKRSKILLYVLTLIALRLCQHNINDKRYQTWYWLIFEWLYIKTNSYIFYIYSCIKAWGKYESHKHAWCNLLAFMTWKMTSETCMNSNATRSHLSCNKRNQSDTYFLFKVEKRGKWTAIW